MLSTLWTRRIQYAFIAIVTLSVGFSLYQWNASRASTNKTAPNNGLVGYWSFNEGTGTLAGDASGNNNTGTFVNSPTWGTGKLGSAMSFNGSTNYVSVSDHSSLNPSVISISAWVYYVSQSGSGGGAIVSKYDNSGSNRSYLVAIDPGTEAIGALVSSTGSSGTIFNDNSLGAVPKNKWSHVVMTYDGANVSLYLNGVKSTTSMAYTGNLFDNSTILSIGARPQGSTGYFGGLVDEVRIYNRALSATEVQSLYDLGASDKVNSSVSQNQGTGRLDSGLAGYWKLDNASGTTATDSSTNANNGTLTNGPTWGTGQVGGAVDFDGSNDYVTVGDPASGVLDFADGTNFTLSGWFNRDTFTTDDMIISKRSVSSSNIGYVLYVDDATDKLTFNGNDGTDSYQLESATAFTATGWYHYAIVWDDSGSGQTKLYINGIAESATATGTFGNVNSMANGPAFLIGATTDGLDVITSTFDGKLDEVRIYNRALSSDEVSQLYRLTTPTGVDTSLKGYWSFNGKDTNWTSSSAGTTTDLSGSGNTGTMTNMNRATSTDRGKLGQALRFDGVDDYVTTTLQNGLSNSFSISAWVKPTDLSQTFGPVVTSEFSDYWIYAGYQISGVPKFSMALYDGSNNPTSLNSTVLPQVNQWFHLVWVRDVVADTINVYVNTVPGTPVTDTTTSVPSYTNLRIGSQVSGASRKFNGIIDEVRVYNRALSAPEISALYNSGR